jgi:hypothetical protein
LEATATTQLSKNAIESLGSFTLLRSLTLEKTSFRSIHDLLTVIDKVFPNIEELKLLMLNLYGKTSLPNPWPPSLRFLQKLKRVEMDMRPHTLPLLSIENLPAKIEYLGFREIISIGHLLRVKQLVEHAGADLLHLNIEIQIPGSSSFRFLFSSYSKALFSY